MNAEDTSIAYKIVLLGDSGVGKTHITRQFVTKLLPKIPHSTIGVEFATKIIQLANGVKVKAQIWDTAGQERYKSITSVHYRKAVGAIIVYDVTNYSSFENCKKWHEELTYLAGDKIKILLAGNKIDLVKANPEKRAVGTNEAQKFASDNGMMFKECSAFTDDNISESFETLLLSVYTEFGDKTNEEGNSIVPIAQKKQEEDDQCKC